MNDFAYRVKSARAEAGLSQPELAKLVHTTQQNISKIERGLASGTTMVGELADALGVNVDWLLRGSGDKRSGDLAAVDTQTRLAANRFFDRLARLDAKQLKALENLVEAFAPPK